MNKKILPIFIINNSFFSFSRTLPGAVIVLIILSNGISLETFTIAKALQLIVSAIITVPAGLIADKYGRKKSILIACICQIVYFSLLINPSNNKVIVAEIMNGIGLAFYSGSYEAWLLNLNEKYQDKKFMNNIFRSTELVFLSIALASLIGAFFSSYVFILTIICLSVVTIIYYFIPEYKNTNKDTSQDKVKSMALLKESTKYLLKNNIGRLLIISSIINIGFMQLIFQFWQPFFKSVGYINHISFAIIFSCTLLGQYYISVLFRKYIYKHISLISGILITSLLSVVAMYLLTIFSSLEIFPLIIVILYVFFSGLLSNLGSLINVLVARNIEEKYHSTGISIMDVVGRLSGAIILFSLIPIISPQNIAIAWFAFGTVILFFALSLYFFQIKSVFKNEKYDIEK